MQALQLLERYKLEPCFKVSGQPRVTFRMVMVSVMHFTRELGLQSARIVHKGVNHLNLSVNRAQDRDGRTTYTSMGFAASVWNPGLAALS